MATVGLTQQSLTQQRGQQYQSASVRSVSTVSTASTATNETSWVGGKKRDWDNAFISKYQEFEATLQENDRWLALYWQSIAGVKDTKRPNVAITEALKASSARRRGRPRMDVRDVFNVGGTTMTLSPVGSRFNTASSWSLRVGKRRSSSGGSQFGGTQGNTLNMAMAQMAMMPPRSPFLTNVAQTTVDSPLARSNSAAAKTAAAVKRLQAMATAPPAAAATPPVMLSPPLSGESQETLLPADEERSPVRAAQLLAPAAASTRFAGAPAAASTRFTGAPVPTLRDMLLLNHRPAAAAAPGAKPPALELHRPRLRTLSSHSSGPSSPEPSAQPSAAVVASEAELTKSEEDVRERLQRVRIALGRHSVGRVPETPLDAVCEQAQRRIDDIAAAISPDASDAELTALCRDIDEVAGMLPLSNDEEEEELGGAKPVGATGSEDADEDTSEEGSLDGAKPVPGVVGKRKHSDDEKPAPAPAHSISSSSSSRLMSATSASLSRGRGRGKARPAPYTTGIPRNAALRTQGSSSSIASAEHSDANHPHPPRRPPGPQPGRVAEARRLFEQPPGSFVSPVAAMRPGYASIVSTPATTAAAGLKRAVKSRIPPAKSASAKSTAAAKLSSTAAMREAARINAAATASRKPQLPPMNHSRIGNEPLFKSVSRELLSHPATSAANNNRRVRPAPLHIANSSSSSGASSSSAIPVPAPAPPKMAPGAVPIPAAGKGKAPSAASASESDASKSSSDSGRGILTSMLSILSPSSWKAQADAPPAAAAAATPTPSASAISMKKIASPYDVTSPQNPYQPRPEHGGSGRLVMPTYQDMAVPLRKSSTRAPSIVKTQNQRLINVAEGGRLSGVSSFRSSFFSDDEGASTTRAAQSPAMARTKSTSDLPGADMLTPVRRPSEEYTSIIAPGQTSPPEIESEYSDEYSDDEFSPAAPPRRKKNDFRIPKWATTPELARGLEMQERVNPDHIFGRVKPLRINEIFNRKDSEEQRRKPRNSSMIWNTKDALTSEEELSYVRKMGYDP